MFHDFARSLAQLGDPRIRRVLLRSILITIAILAALLTALWHGIAQIHVSQHWLQWIIDILGLLIEILLAWVLFSVVASVVVSFYLDDVADAVEALHYPGLALPRRQGTAELIREGLRFAGISVLLNLLALPAYAVLSFVPPTNLLVFYGLNGYLLSREYFELVAFRRLDPREARRLRLAHPARMLLAGILIAFMLTVPVVNLLTPVFATVWMVHLYHGLAGRSAPGGS